MNDKVQPGSLGEYVRQMLSEYYATLEGEDPCELHALTIRQVEKPLIEFTLHRYAYNQTKAAEVLGINRNTLRKKIHLYQIKSDL